MKRKEKYREDLLDIACAGFILGVGFTIFALRAFIEKRDKEKLKTT